MPRDIRQATLDGSVHIGSSHYAYHCGTMVHKLHDQITLSFCAYLALNMQIQHRPTTNWDRLAGCVAGRWTEPYAQMIKICAQPFHHFSWPGYILHIHIFFCLRFLCLYKYPGRINSLCLMFVFSIRYAEPRNSGPGDVYAVLGVHSSVQSWGTWTAHDRPRYDWWRR